MFNGRIDLELKSFLHIGKDKEDNYAMATNGDGKHILPASSIAGSVRSYLETINPEGTIKMFGIQDGNQERYGRVYIYDAEIKLSDNGFEKRMGVEINEKKGTAENRKLYSGYYIAAGAKASIMMQAFCDDKDDFTDMFKDIIAGINSGQITFGAKKTNGAGRFEATGYAKILDLKNSEDLERYLKGLNAIEFVAKDKVDDINGYNHAFDEYRLLAEIPNDLLVKDGERHDGVDNANMRHGETGDYFIPGSSIKGMIRAYGCRLLRYYDHTLDQVEKKDLVMINNIFGDASGDAHTAGHVFCEDVIIEHPLRTVYNRIKIDRVLGGTITNAKMTEEVLSTKHGQTIEIVIRIIHRGMEENMIQIANAIVFLALRNLGAGFIPIGSGNNVGYGRLQGTTLKINETEYTYQYKDNHVELHVDNETMRQCLEKLKDVSHGTQE